MLAGKIENDMEETIVHEKTYYCKLFCCAFDHAEALRSNSFLSLGVNEEKTFVQLFPDCTEPL